MKCEFTVIIYDGVASIGSSLKSYDNISFLRELISNFTFTFVSPISTNNSFNHKDIHPPQCRLSK